MRVEIKSNENFEIIEHWELGFPMSLEVFFFIKIMVSVIFSSFISSFLKISRSIFQSKTNAYLDETGDNFNKA